MYYHTVEGKRLDIRLLNFNGVANNDRIISPLWSKKQKSNAWRKFTKHTDRPIYSRNKSLANDISGKTGLSYISGIVYKVNYSIAPRTIKLEANDSAKAFFKKMLALPDTRNRWASSRRDNAIRDYGKYLGYAIPSPAMENSIKDVLPLAENNYWSLVGMTSSLLRRVSKHEKVLLIAEKYLEKAKLLAAGNHRAKADVAYLFHLKGLIAKKKGNSRKARNLFRKSIKINPKKNNPAYKALKEL